MGRSVDAKTHISVKWQETTTKQPVVYISGLFHGSQLNWAAMTKEAYAIYMTIKKSTFYITGHDVTLRSDHLPLNKFSQADDTQQYRQPLGDGN